MDSPPLRLDEELGTWDPAWPDADVIVLPGFPGRKQPADERVQNPYPDTTLDMVKILRSNDRTVEHAVERSERQEISLNAAECWVPILVFANDLGAETCVNLLVNAIRQIVGALQLQRTRLHVRFGRQRPDGTVEFFEGHGDGDKVLEAIRLYGEGQAGGENRL